MVSLGDHLFVSDTSLVVDGDREICVIDPGCNPGSVLRLLDHCRAGNKAVTKIILSHGHADHSANIDKYLEHFPSLSLLAGHNSYLASLPNSVVMDEGSSVDMVFSGVEFRVLSTPGHTRCGDDISVYFPEEHVLFCGDLAQPQGPSYGISDFQTPLPFYHDGKKYLQSLDHLCSLDFSVLVTGHGNVLYGGAGRDWLCITKQVVERTRDLVYKLVAENPRADDRMICEWVLKTIGYERRVSKEPIAARLAGGSPNSDFELYDAKGIIFWIAGARSAK